MHHENDAGETSSIRRLKSMMDGAPDTPGHARRSAPSYYEHTATQIVEKPARRPNRITRFLWNVEEWLKARAQVQRAKERRKALERLNVK